MGYRPSNAAYRLKECIFINADVLLIAGRIAQQKYFSNTPTAILPLFTYLSSPSSAPRGYRLFIEVDILGESLCVADFFR